MFFGRQTDVRLNNILKRALRAVYNDEVRSFTEPLEENRSEIIHQRNIKVLAANLLNDITTQLVCKRNSVGCNLCPQTDISLPQVKSANYGLKAL